jgi:hypothetical protein
MTPPDQSIGSCPHESDETAQGANAVAATHEATLIGQVYRGHIFRHRIFLPSHNCRAIIAATSARRDA